MQPTTFPYFWTLDCAQYSIRSRFGILEQGGNNSNLWDDIVARSLLSSTLRDERLSWMVTSSGLVEVFAFLIQR